MTENEKKALAEIEARLQERVLTYREIAELLGVSHGTVQNIERRALAKLRKYARKGEH